MKAIQKIIIVIYGLLVAVACVYVPWASMVQEFPISLGYSPIWKPILFEAFASTPPTRYINNSRFKKGYS